MTEAKRDLISLSLSSDRRFIKEWVEGDTIWPVTACMSMDLYDAYIKWCKQNGESRPRASNMFLGMIRNMTGWTATRLRIYTNTSFVGKTKPERVVIPPDDLLQISGSARAPDVEQPRWLTECIEAFKSAGRSDDNGY